MNADFLKKINDNLFITTETKSKKNYEWVPPESLETRFGVELEACIRTTPDCINFDTNLLNIVNFTFKDKFDIYYKNIIIKSKFFKKLAEKYDYLYVYDKEKQGRHFYYDMNEPKRYERDIQEAKKEAKRHRVTEKDAKLLLMKVRKPELRGMSEKELIDFKRKETGANTAGVWNQYIDNPADQVNLIVQKAHNYELPMFVDDLSIRCGDTKGLIKKQNAGITDINSFRFECITPILSIKGKPTRKKIKEVLYPLLSLFGLDKPQCFIQNFSMGFHVNVSLYNTKADKYVAIAEPPFLNQLLKNYIPQEKTIYPMVRTRKPINAPNTQNYTTEFARPLHKNLNQFKKNNPTLTENQIINTIMTEKKYINEKYKAIKRKSAFLLEFRLFEADDKIDNLVNHVSTTLSILHKTASDIVKTTKLTLVKPNLDIYNEIEEPAIDPNRINETFTNYYNGARKTLKKKYRLKKHRTSKRTH